MHTSENLKVALIVPTRNASRFLDKFLIAFKSQTLKVDDFIVVDSASSDNTVEIMKSSGARVIPIHAETFNHGGTRRQASELTDADVLVYMTQDAILATPDSLKNIVNAVVSSPSIGCAYGRQLPIVGSGLLGAHGRMFNYPPQSKTKSLLDAPNLGIKTCFSSDSFAAYRRKALEDIGGFPKDVIGSEDSYVAGQMQLKGWSVRYEAEALVYHSHDYTVIEEFKRYFDIGVFYGREHWIKQHFGTAGNEGLKFVISEFRMILNQHAYHLIPEYPLRIIMKAIGYRVGKLEKYLPNSIKRRISMFPGYWK